MTNKLVAYFSASGTTKNIAEKMAKVAGADIYEIETEKKYTDADLDWTNPESRTSIEMNKNRDFRPPIAGNVVDISQYDTLIIGFPIWWYVAPTIINTFLEQYDLNGKKIVLFATSGSSDMGNTIKELKPSASGAEFVAEKRFASSTSQNEIFEWFESLNI